MGIAQYVLEALDASLFFFVLDKVLKFRMFWTSVVQDVETMNKNVDPMRPKKLLFELVEPIFP